MENAQRKREILDVCLATFIRRGLYETSVRDLSRALALQSGGIYYWFKDKDDVVVTCAEEAALRLEEHLIAPALQDIREPDRMMERLRLRSDELRPMMKFFASVCACSRYEERLRPVLGRLFPSSRSDPELAGELSCNMSANLLGLGNAATPAGIRAAQRLHALSGKGAASDELCRLAVLTTASVQLLPTTAAALRSACGAENAFDILPAVWISSAAGVAAGLLAERLFRRAP